MLQVIIRVSAFGLLSEKLKIRGSTALEGPKKLQIMKMLLVGQQIMFSSSCSSWPQRSLGLHSPSCSLLHTWILQFPESYQSLALLPSSQSRVVLTFAYSLSSSLANGWERVHLFLCLREYIPILSRAFKWENFVTKKKRTSVKMGKEGFQ